MAVLNDLYSKYFPGQDPRGYYDSYNMTYYGGLTPEALRIKAAQAGNLEDFLFASGEEFKPLGFYDGPTKEYIQSVLNSVSSASGQNNYDWTAAINRAAMKHAGQFGGRGFQVDSPLPNVIEEIVYASNNPEIRTNWEHGGLREPILSNVQNTYQQVWNASKDQKKAHFTRSVISMAAVLAGGYFGATAGAGAGGAGAGATGGAGSAGYGAAWEGLGGLATGGEAAAATASTLPAGSFQVAQAGGTMSDVSPGLMDVTGGGTAATGGEATLGSGLTPGAAGAGGLSTTAGGASGISGTQASGALAPGFFGSETAAPVLGGATTAALQGGGAATQGAYKFPWQQSIAAALQLYSANQQGKTAKDLQQQMMDSDQWRTQQPRYFEPIFDAATKGIGETAYGQSIANAAARKSASMGYNLSPNQTMEIARGLNTGSMDAVRAMTPLATGRGESQSFGTFGPAQIAAQNQQLGAIGYGLGSIFQGNQPNMAQQIGGQPTNKNLYESMVSL